MAFTSWPLATNGDNLWRQTTSKVKIAPGVGKTPFFCPNNSLIFSCLQKSWPQDSIINGSRVFIPSKHFLLEEKKGGYLTHVIQCISKFYAIISVGFLNKNLNGLPEVTKSFPKHRFPSPCLPNL